VTGSHVRARLAVLGALAVAALATGCSAGIGAETSQERPAVQGVEATLGKVALRDVYIEPSATGGPDLAYLVAVLVNSGPTPDTLDGISSTAATSITASTGATTFPLNDGTLLALTDPVTGETGLTVSMSLSQPATVGLTIPVTFSFASAGSTTLQVPVYVNPGTTATSTPIPVGS